MGVSEVLHLGRQAERLLSVAGVWKHQSHVEGIAVEERKQKRAIMRVFSSRWCPIRRLSFCACKSKCNAASRWLVVAGRFTNS